MDSATIATRLVVVSFKKALQVSFEEDDLQDILIGVRGARASTSQWWSRHVPVEMATNRVLAADRMVSTRVGRSLVKCQILKMLAQLIHILFKTPLAFVECARFSVL